MKLKIKEGFESVIRVKTGGRQFKLIKFGPRPLFRISIVENLKIRFFYDLKKDENDENISLYNVHCTCTPIQSLSKEKCVLTINSC